MDYDWGICRIFLSQIFLIETIIPCESNSHARCMACIPHVGSELQTSCKVDVRRSRKGEKTQTENIRQSNEMNQANKMIACDASAVFRHRPPWATAADHCPDDFGFCLLAIAALSGWTLMLRYLCSLLFEGKTYTVHPR